MILVLLGCGSGALPPDIAAPASPEPAAGPVVVLAGGGSEGEVDDPKAWSALLYPSLWRAGDVNGDGLVRVVILSVADESDWLPGYFVALGAGEAENLRVATRERAEADETAEVIRSADALFIKGGDQGEYYDRYRGTALSDAVAQLVAVGGGVGGTSAGAMSLGGWVLAGGMDLTTTDVLEDACTPYLEDQSDGGSGLHDDFLGLIPEVLVDTHFTQRARLGRLAGALARLEDEAGASVLGVGIEEETGLIVQEVDGDLVATVVGVGAVSFLAGGDHPPVRVPGEPLRWVGLNHDRLTDGWAFNLNTREVIPAPDAEEVSPTLSAGPVPEGWDASGDLAGHEERFSWVVERDPLPYRLRPGRGASPLPDSVAILDAFDEDRRAAGEEALFRALYDQPGVAAFAVARGARLRGLSAERIGLEANDAVSDAPAATIIHDSSAVSARGLSPSVSLSDPGDGGLHAAALVGLRMHVLYTPADGVAWHQTARTPAGP